MRALVLSGGANKGSYQVGVLKHLLGDLKTHYDLICGISVGALNAAFLSMFEQGQEEECIGQLESLWRTLVTEDIYKSWVPLPGFLENLGFVIALFKSSLYNSRPLEELVKGLFQREKIINSGKQIRVGAVGMESGEYRLFNQDHPDIVKAIIASAAFPLAFCPVEIEGQPWLDGGIREVTPLKAAIDAGADSIDIIMTAPVMKESVSFDSTPPLLNLGTRILDIMTEEILDNDVDRAFEINRIIQNGANVPGKRFIEMRLFRPETKLVDNSLLFEQEFIRPMIIKGYEQAKEITSS